MRLIEILPGVLVNPEHISHIRHWAHPSPDDEPTSHRYPVYTVTMVDGREYDIKRITAYPNEGYPWLHLQVPGLFDG